MMRLFKSDGRGGLTEAESVANAIWVDLLNPAPEVLDEVTRISGIRLPARADMEEIELSSRLYHLDGTDYLTLVLPALTESTNHEVAPVTFALAEDRLVTLRYHAPRPFQSYPIRAGQNAYDAGTPAEVLYGILDEIIDRMADILEASDQQIANTSRDLFDVADPVSPHEMRALLATLGRSGALVSDVRNSLVTIERAVGFLGRTRESEKKAPRTHRGLNVLASDAQSLAEHAAFLHQKLALALDAGVGLTSIQQNADSKTFSLVAVLFLPPTLIGTVFGMNFPGMPLTGTPAGFALSLGAMVLSSVVSYLYFRWRRFL